MEWKLLSKYRAPLMGLATLWIILLHSTAWFSSFPLGYLKATGYCGVDSFLILSSIGLLFSWNKNGKDTKSFLKRRFIRIMPAYVFIALIRCFMEHTGKRYFVLLSSTLSFWILDDLSMWFIAGIVLLYLFSPLFLKTFDSPNWRKWYVLYFILAFLLGVLMKPTPQNVFFTRIPSFLLGFLIGKRIYEKEELKTQEKILLLISFLIGSFLMILCQKGMLDNHGTIEWAVRWYSSLLFNVPLMLGMACLIDRFSKKQILWPENALGFIGRISLEVYLWFEVLLRFFRGTKLEFLPFEYHGVVYSTIIALLTILIAWLTHLLFQKVTERFA